MNFKLKHSLARKIIVANDKEGNLYSMCSKRIIGHFHTSIGYKEVDPSIVTIYVESPNKGFIEVVAGTSMSKTAVLIKTIIKDKIAFEDLESEIELKCNYSDIDEEIEYRLKELKSFNEVAATKDE